MKLTERDVEKIKWLKSRYGYEQTSELIRYMITMLHEKELEKSLRGDYDYDRDKYHE